MAEAWKIDLEAGGQLDRDSLCSEPSWPLRVTEKLEKPKLL